MTDIVCSLEEIELFEKSNGLKLDYVKFSFVNLHGIVISKVVSRKFLEKFLKNELNIYAGFFCWDIEGQSTIVKELQEQFFGNCQLVPMKNTIHILPWNGKECLGKVRTVGELICEGRWISPYKDGAFIEACSRTVLRKQLQNLKEMGFLLKSAFEIEFSLLCQKTLKPVINKTTQTINSQLEDLLFEIMEVCEKAGVELSNYVLEDTSGQIEFNLPPLEGIKATDDVIVAKQAIKEVCISRGYLASFMAKPVEEMATNGFHLNLSLWERSKDGTETNSFYCGKAEKKMSDLCKCFLGGLMKHAKALTALFSPTVNCYRRLHTYMCPDKISWNFDDRFVSFRVRNSASSCFLENRIPSSACNVYLTTAATLAAGMDGIKKMIPLPEPSKEIYDGSSEKNNNVKNDVNNYLPYSLTEAFEELEKDEVLKDLLGRELVDWFIMSKKRTECDAINSADEETHWDLERKMYLRSV